jgi:hypothetical protein
MRRNTLYYEESSGGAIHALCGDSMYVVILDYEGIGKGGDYTAPLRYFLEKADRTALYRLTPISRNKVEKSVKNFFKKAIPLVDAGQRVVMTSTYRIVAAW